VTTAAGAHDQQLVLYYPASVSRAFLVGLLAMPRFARRECLHKSIVINLIRAIVVAFTLIVKSRPREAARHRLHSRNRTQRRAP
jgi:hypothetical protein